ncbi:PH domain-containing protein [Roseiconus nitratireducens]|uniref:PH domain-containing protein n=1 Tax=Roseiconus nitratireducens TaxID=2605748 RepID=UPI001375CAB6|nr:PH domain-containing protein [Roseiconus nitratireducens]
MTGPGERSAEWVYRGIWKVLVDLFRVPNGPPCLPKEFGQSRREFHPSRAYLAYLKAYFWVALVAFDGALLIAWGSLFWFNTTLAWWLAVPVWLLAILPDLVAYIVIHLRYDTIWYAISDRGLYVRRGIWVITEHSITLANVQNVVVHQGPIEQLFSIATVTVETAAAGPGEHQNALFVGNQTIMVGLSDADQICELLMRHVRATPSAGLGDDLTDGSNRWTGADLALLCSIRDEARLLNAPRGADSETSDGERESEVSP